jgi:hypothetical protein
MQGLRVFKPLESIQSLRVLGKTVSKYNYNMGKATDGAEGLSTIGKTYGFYVSKA